MKEKSYMVAIPENESTLTDVAGIMNRLSQAPGINLVSHDFDEMLEFTLEIYGQTYTVEVRPIDVEIPEMFRIQHFFPDIDIEAVEKAQTGLLVCMEYGEEPLISYHIQLKMIAAMVPDVIAVLDESSEKILSGRWIKLAANSSVPPAPRYLYTVQAVSGEEDECVWLHSHGLNRCGITELEILNSTKETYNSHYSVIETMANRLLEVEEMPEYHEPFFLARMTEDVAMMATLVEWQEAVEHYPDDMLGGKADRQEGHNENTSCIFVYPTYEDFENGEYAPVSVYDEFMQNNPLYMISNRETERMKKLARERLTYMLKAFENKQNKIIVKIGLRVDEEYREEQNEYEHIWFELVDVLDGKIKGILTQEPYYVKDMHEGSEGIYSYDEITDWMIFTKERRVTPDDVYLIGLN